MGVAGVGYFAGLVWATNIILSSPDIAYGSCKAIFLQDGITSATTGLAVGVVIAIAGGPAAGFGVGVLLFSFLASVMSVVNVYNTSCLSGTEGPT